ncbi:unnamed protein product [Polarella glacialis]|uniref:Uncharacterized protein n=1 Tax=Polarella glacialis TaxID=89957 RepID=A0A813EEL1_POLGL|nr:unnamed protein product [Polarella glacialis]
MSLREQLDENEGLIQGLTQQLDMVQAELQERLRQCEALERKLASALVEAAAAVAAGAAKSCKVDVVQEAGEGKACSTSAGIVPELLARIAELEATLEGVTCGAKDQSQAKTFASQKNGEVSTFEPPPRLGDKAASLMAASS